MSSEERKQILEMIASGAITASQGLALLQALGDDAGTEVPPAAAEIPASVADVSEGTPAATNVGMPGAGFDVRTTLSEGESALPGMETTSPKVDKPFAEPVLLPSVEDAPLEPVSGAIPPQMNRWRNWWRIPMVVGVVVTIASAALMFSAWQASRFGFWFACSWFPFMLGVAFIALAWASRKAVWLHLRIRQRPGERPANINISLPVPIRLTSWLLRVFRPNIPGMQGADLDTLLQALDSTSRGQPFYMEVNDEDGEHVEIFIG